MAISLNKKGAIMGLFISFEGGEGSGKNTQANILAERLRKQKKWGVLPIEEPGTTPIGKQVRKWLSSPDDGLVVEMENPYQLTFFDDTDNESPPPTVHIPIASPRAELLAFTIARSQLVDEIIEPNIEKNTIIICVRYADSTTAYQGYGRGLDLRLVKLANRIATKNIMPRLTVLLDMPPKRGLAKKFGGERQSFEKEILEFHERVRDGYLTLAQQDQKRWLVIDATLEIETISDIIWQKVSRLLPRKQSIVVNNEV